MDLYSLRSSREIKLRSSRIHHSLQIIHLGHHSTSQNSSQHFLSSSTHSSLSHSNFRGHCPRYSAAQRALFSFVAACADIPFASLFAFAVTMSSLFQPRPVLSSQRYSQSPDYVDARRGIHGGRVPLRESTGNAQSHNFNGLVSCYQNQVALSPSMQSNIPAPMVPSQSLDCLYRVPTPRQQPRYQRRPKTSINPLYFWPAFRQYRNRQAHKDTQKDKGGVWRRPELEDAFVDCMSNALLHHIPVACPVANMYRQLYCSCPIWAVASSPWEASFTVATC